MATIDLSNYATSLFQASSNSFTDGNVFFDKAAGTLEYGDATDYPTLDLTSHGGGATDPNPLIRLDGVKMEATYAFENQERKVDEDLRKYKRWTQGTFKFGGSYKFVNGRKPANDATRALHRGSGWDEINAAGVITRKYFGPKGLGAILPTSTPYWQPSQYASSIDFAKGGNIDEAVLVYQDDAATGTPTLDNTAAAMYMSIRTYGQNYDRIDTAGTLGIAELGGYSTGAALNESNHLTSGDYNLADVYTTPISPWDGMSLEKLATPQTETGFAGPDADFSWILHNTGGGSLAQCVAYLDAIAQADAIVTDGTASLNGKDYDTWYTYTPSGKVRPITGAGDGLGVFIEDLPVSDLTQVEFLDDNGLTAVYPVFTPVQVELGSGAIADTEAWFHCFLAANYDTAAAATYEDANSAEVKGVADNTSPFISGANTYVSFSHDYTTDGSTNVVFLCEGDGGVTQALTAFTITDSAVSQSCIPTVETNV
jgi:hypothetical protein